MCVNSVFFTGLDVDGPTVQCCVPALASSDSRAPDHCRLVIVDQGYKLGEWRIGCSKQHPYESDVHIPFFARGPGIKPGTRLTQLAANIDITPTLINIAGHFPSPDHDGRSLLPLLTGPSSASAQLVHGARGGDASLPKAVEPWRTSLIIEYLSVGTYYNDHAKVWVAGPWGNGSLEQYGNGPYSPEPRTVDNNSSNCAATEGEGLCYFVDSKASNNWIALRVSWSPTFRCVHACLQTHSMLWLGFAVCTLIGTMFARGRLYGIKTCMYE